MAVNPQFLVAAVDLSEVFVDKDTGQLLSGGQISFFQDNDHVTPKLVYTIQNNNPALPPNYTYVPLPNPITLSATGQFQDNAGNNIPVYYYPVDAAGNLQLYYITVTNSNGVQQFTRQGWPPNESQIQPPPGGQTGGISNQITNSQFLDVNFIPANGITFNYVGAAVDSIAIAPDWNLVINHTGNGTLTVARNAVQGSSAYPYNPPYTLTVTPGVNIAALQLIQKIPNNPDVFSASLLGVGGYVSASILLSPASVATISYMPNGQAAQLILTANNTSGAYAQFNNTAQLTPASNPSTGDTGSVNIVVGLNTAAATTFSNIQIVPLNANINNVPYDQRTANRERDFEFNYFNNLLQYKPIPSFLIGWDFPLNPTQFLGVNGGPFATGANTSNYVWDQTIVFQNTNNGFTFTRGNTHGGSAGLLLTIAANTRVALIQYLDNPQAKKILNGMVSVMVAGTGPNVNSTISLWACTDMALPLMSANASLVATLSPTGKPATLNGTWVEVPRNGLGSSSTSGVSLLGDATFVLQQGTGPIPYLNVGLNGFTGWMFPTATTPNASNFFAIVVGLVNATGAPIGVVIESISCVPGIIPTIPAPQKIDEVYRECYRYYANSFNGAVPATQVGVNTGCANFMAGKAGAANEFSSNIPFFGPMRAAPTMTYYNPVNNNAQAYDVTATADCSATTSFNVTTQGFNISATGNGGTAVGNDIQVHWTADARLGLV